MQELLPCPFCGGEAETERTLERFEYGIGGPDSVMEYGYYVYCKKCSAGTSVVDVPPPSEEEAIAEWNKRAPLPFAVEVQPPQQVREQVALDTGIDADLLRFVVYNDTDKGAWLHADDDDRARLVAQVSELQARVTELESAIVIDRGVFNRLCTLQAIMEHPTATPSAEEFNEYTGLLELVFHRHDKEAADNE